MHTVFFFQAEDGIRDLIVTGVQTCAFFFSSRRRHTRSDRDWSSDVCSSDLLLQAFQGVSAVITLVLAAAVAERTEAVDRLRRLAVSDPLTGLSNYRQLAHALDAEIRRSSRTDRPFAVVLMDLDGLKKVNDRYGHLVGSMALRRVAEALLGSCRGIDTAARFGGDEFALVLPETGDAAAWHVARRVADRVARDGEQPPL